MTLVELLMVIAITGILSVALLDLFRAGITGWYAAAEITRFQMNASRLYQVVGRDVRASQQFIQVDNDQVIVQQPNNRIRFRILGQGEQQKLIREVHDYAKNQWDQLPRYPIADFTGVDVTITFTQQSSHTLDIRVANDHYQLETIVCKRL